MHHKCVPPAISISAGQAHAWMHTRAHTRARARTHARMHTRTHMANGRLCAGMCKLDVTDEAAVHRHLNEVHGAGSAFLSSSTRTRFREINIAVQVSQFVSGALDVPSPVLEVKPLPQHAHAGDAEWTADAKRVGEATSSTRFDIKRCSASELIDLDRQGIFAECAAEFRSHDVTAETIGERVAGMMQKATEPIELLPAERASAEGGGFMPRFRLFFDEDDLFPDVPLVAPWHEDRPVRHEVRREDIIRFVWPFQLNMDCLLQRPVPVEHLYRALDHDLMVT